MTDLFTHHDVACIGITKYVAWFLDKSSPNFNLAQLPPIQRNSVWNIAQVERLWDSLLRGFPIGSILLAHRTHGQAARSLTSTQQIQVETDGYFLLDGQQRTRSLLLGFQPTESSRLWVDLSPQLTFGNAEYNDRKFLFRLLTGHHPWGMSRHNPEAELPDSRKHDARQELSESCHYDYLIKPVAQKSESYLSWPLDAEVPVPLDALLQLCGGWRGPFTRPSWSQVRPLVPTRFSPTEVEPTHLTVLLAAIENLLAPAPTSGRPQRSIPLLLHHEPLAAPVDSTAADQSPDSVETLFRRVNAGGTVLAGEEMAYSLLKSSWDQAYELVSQVVNHAGVGYLFPPTGVVMAATRLARRQQGQQDLNPSVPQFRRWLGQSSVSSADSEFIQEMKALLILAPGQSEGQFAQILDKFCRLAIYNPDASSPTDPGLPRKLLLDLNPILLHPVLSWLHDNLADVELLTTNRLGVLRYLLYLLVVRPDAQKYARLAVEVVDGLPLGADFPDQAIYLSWLGKADAPALPDQPYLIRYLPAHITQGWLSNEEELFGPSSATENKVADPYHQFRAKFWHHRHLLLWFQRTYLDRWFKGYNPMRQDTADTPYDYDHIVPYSHAVRQGRRSLQLIEEGEGQDRFYWNRYFYLNSLGNFRVWPAWTNRADGNTCHTEKLYLPPAAFLVGNTSRELQLTSATDYLRASAVLERHADLWSAAGGSPGQWPTPRRAAWMQAVEQRASALYEELFTTLNYGNWYQAASQLPEKQV